LIDLKLNSRPLHFVAAKGKAKAKTKTVNKVVLVDDSQFHRVQRQPRVNFTASRGPVELCAAFEKIPLDSGADFIDVSLWLAVAVLGHINHRDTENTEVAQRNR
jgi:hypothetical protein